MKEFDLIGKIKKLQKEPLSARVGIGDDAAWMRPSVRGTVVSTDMIVDGVDFLWKRDRPESIAHKALAINLSDMAAMGAIGDGFVISIGMPKTTNEAWVLRFYRGLFKTAKKYGVECVGGDLSAADDFFVSITIFGHPAATRPVLRGGARPGDWIAVTGCLGGSILKKHLNFKPRVDEGIFLARQGYARAMIDVSDGFVQDLEHLIAASKVGADIDLALIPVSADARKLAGKQKDKAIQHALSDGEDFELLFTVSARKKQSLDKVWHKKFPRTPLSWVGRCTSGKSRVQWYNGRSQFYNFKLNNKGFNHFS